MSSIVITGARGYIGGALARQLAQAGCALRLVSRGSEIARVAGAGAARIAYVQADLRGERAWSELLAGAQAVVHLSARTDLRAAEADPAGDEDLNVEPVRALARAAAAQPIKPRIVFASAVTIVGARPELPVDERTPDRPISVYDRHKLACEEILRAASRRDGVPACSLRLPNVYGYGGASINRNRGILNAMIERAARGEPLTLYGDGRYIRDFIHLDDVVEAFAAALRTPHCCDGSHYVLATGQGHSLAEAFQLVAQCALAQCGTRVDIRSVPEPDDLHPIERRDFVGNARRFTEATGWRSRFDLAAGIRDYFVRADAQPAAAVGG